MAKKQKAHKPISEMTDEERLAELEKLCAEQATHDARRQKLYDTGFYDWREANDTENYGDVWLAAYRKGMEDAAQTVEGLDTPSPELQDVIAAAIRESLNSN